MWDSNLIPRALTWAEGRHTHEMRANREDDAARAILARAPDPIDSSFVDSLDQKERVRLGRYGFRRVIIALRIGSVDMSRHALLLSGLGAHHDDDRDTMVGLALPWVVAHHLGTDPAELFAEVADQIPDPHTAELLRGFGARTDITLRAFGWEMITTIEGPDLRRPP